MEDSSNFRKTAQSQDAISDMQIDIHKKNTKHLQERANQLVQNFYNKACGCSVKAQENNLFDYKSQIKEEESF